MQTSIDLSELSKLNSTIESLKLKPEQIAQAGAGIRLIIQADVDRRFQTAPLVETGGTVWGDAEWAPLSGEYLDTRPIRIGGQILRDTGELQQSFTAEGSIYEASNTELVFGSALPKASRLNRDRPIVFWHPYLVEQVAEYLSRWAAS